LSRNGLFAVGITERMGNMSDNLGFDWGANSFGDLFNVINTVNLVDNMALLDWYWGVYNFWVVQAVLSYDFVARRSVSFFMGSVCNWSSKVSISSQN